jgi:hypothetical protein
MNKSNKYYLIGPLVAVLFFTFLLLQLFLFNVLDIKSYWTSISISLSVIFLFIFIGFNHKELSIFLILLVISNPVLILLGEKKFSNFIAKEIFIFLIATVIVYVLLHNRINEKILKFKKFSGILSLFFIIVFILVNILINFDEIKMNMLRTVAPERYFVEIDEKKIDGNYYRNEMIFNLDTATPENGSSINDEFIIEGWAIDKSGSEIDFVLVYLDNPPMLGGKYLGRCDYGFEREDIKNAFGEDFVNSGFRCSFNPSDFEMGPHVFYIYFHSADFGWKHTELELIINN